MALKTESGVASFGFWLRFGRVRETGDEGAVLARVFLVHRSILSWSWEFCSISALAVSSAATARERSLRLLSSIAAMVSSTTFITARA